MAHGGGTWLTQNKVMPGTYINFSSLAKASAALSDRGVAALPLELDWGPEGTIMEVTLGDFQKNCKTLFGYSFDAPVMLPLRELFCHATKAYIGRLGSEAVKASNTYATARYGGTRGNEIRIVIAKNVDDADLWDVSTIFDSERVDTQTVVSAGDLVANDYVVFKHNATLAITAGTALTGGTNATINGAAHSAFLELIENYAYNALCCPSSDADTIALYAAFTRRVRDELGAKFQLITWRASTPDYEGVISVYNTVAARTPEYALVYWVTGAQAGVAVNKSLTNAEYDGELTVDANATQAKLESSLTHGEFIFHNVNGTVRVLEDINTLVTLTDEKGAEFQSNQTMRVCDQIANDVAVLFNTRYIGIVPNDASGRATLWGDVVKLIQQLSSIRAVEDFNPEIVTVATGDNKRSVVLTINGLTVVNAMSQLYMSVIIQ